MCVAVTDRTLPHAAAADFPSICSHFPGTAVAHPYGVLWFLERNAQLMVCEVRRAGNGVYEYEETAPTGKSRVERYHEASDLLDGYIRAQQEKQREGWRPRLLSYT